MSALSELLNRHFAEKYPNTSNRKIAAEAGVSRGTIDNYRNGTHPAAPSDEVLTAFHKLLGIPMGELREAANLPVGEDAPYVPPREANLLSLRQRRAVDEMIRSIVETRGASSHDTDQPASDADRPPASGTPRETREGEKTSFGRVGQALSGVQDKPDGLNEQQSSLEAGEVVHMVPPPAGTAPYTLAASAHWPDGVDVDASGTADEYQAWLDDGSPDTWRVYRERRNAGLRPAALDYGPDDEGESERAAREQDEAAEGSQDGEE